LSLTKRALQKLGLEVVDKGADRRCYGICPFHQDRHPTNWFIRLRGERAGQHHCFACKAKGGLLDLIAHRRGCSLKGAREWLDQLRGGEEVEGVRLPEDEIRLVVSGVGTRAFQLPREVRFGSLGSWTQTARRYAERRHLTEAQVADWGIGYATSGRLAGRIVIPVRDRDGVAWSYMARTFADHQARYYYPAERERADLDVVFGEQWWPRDGTLRRETVVVAEGALNALAVERAVGGWASVAALGGSDVRPIHVGKLAAFGTVLVMTDDDRAGEGAAEELMVGLARHTRVVRVSLGAGMDADDMDPAELEVRLCRST
jgi:DNA primase